MAEETSNVHQILAEDFKVHFHLVMDREEDNEYAGDPSLTVHVLAYLILPTKYSKTFSGPGNKAFAYLNTMILDPSLLQEPTMEERARFVSAMNTLQLEFYLPQTEFDTRVYPTSDRYSTGPPEWRKSALRKRKLVDEADVTESQLGPSDANGAILRDWPKLMVLGSGHEQVFR